MFDFVTSSCFIRIGFVGTHTSNQTRCLFVFLLCSSVGIKVSLIVLVQRQGCTFEPSEKFLLIFIRLIKKMSFSVRE